MEPFLAVVSGIALLSIVFYVILKQNPYRHLRNKELVFAEDVRKELQDEFAKMRKALLSGIVICLAALGIGEMYFAHEFRMTWETMDALLGRTEMLHDLTETILYMIFVGICGFTMIFCAGVYWSYAALLRNSAL